MLLLLIIIFALAAIIMLKTGFQEQEQVIQKTDAIKVKEEYALYNNQINENNQRTYPFVNLADNNLFKISNEEEIIDILTNKTGLIYFGYATDAYCRTLMPILDKVSLENQLDNIYYLNIEYIRDLIELDDRGEPIKKEEGTKGYYKIMEILNDNLDEYILNNQEYKDVDAKEKRIIAPTMVAVKDGEILKIHVKTLPSQKSGFDELDIEEEKELEKIVTDLIKEIK